MYCHFPQSWTTRLSHLSQSLWIYIISVDIFAKIAALHPGEITGQLSSSASGEGGREKLGEILQKGTS